MHDDMRALLNGYLDGELHGARLQEIQRHLTTCESCRNELMELRLVSDLLQADASPEFMPAERFVTNLALRLPRWTLHDQPQKPGFLACWLVPAGLLGAWIFVQTVFAITDLVTAADLTGILGQAANWLGGGHQMAWFMAVAGLFGSQAGGVQSTISLLNKVDVFGANLLKGFLWQALIVLAYWSWLLFVWLSRRPQLTQMENAS
jgi:anti-sigma factor RsiW